jgi:hypothetical protein
LPLSRITLDLIHFFRFLEDGQCCLYSGELGISNFSALSVCITTPRFETYGLQLGTEKLFCIAKGFLKVLGAK